MDQYAVVYFPDINTDQIQTLRAKYDPSWNILPPHITLVSPFSDFPEDQILNHLRKATEHIHPFNIRLHGLQKTEDQFIFLLIEEGNDSITRMHQQLYSGIFTSLEQKYVFNPHITLGEFSVENSNLIATAYAEADTMNFDMKATFDNVTLIRGNGIAPAKTVEVFRLE